MTILIKRLVIKHGAYLGGPTSKGTIACTRRPPVIVEAKLLTNTDRFTNSSYNLLTGSEVPIKRLSVRNYVVFLSPSKFNKPAASSSFRKGSPKLVLRRKRTEFAMTRSSKEQGLRRVHSTVPSCRKEPSYVRFDKDMLSGVYKSDQLDLLRFYIISNKKCVNLSNIMSDTNFLIASWVRIRSKKGSLKVALDNQTLDGISLSWFEETANSMRNGIFQFSPSRRTYISKSNGKKRPLTIPSLRDKIVQEAMRFLLTLVFEGDFSKNSHGWVTGRGCHTALNQIKLEFAHDNWLVEGDIDQQFSSLNHQVLVSVLKTKIDDQAFIDLIYKYLRVGYGKSLDKVEKMRIGTSQGGVLSPVLANIYMTPFDKWVEKDLIPRYTKGKRKKANPIYTKMIRSGKVTDHSIPSMCSHDQNYIRLHYVRYADDFIMGLNGPKIYCKQIVDECKIFLSEQLKLTLNIEKTKITHSESDSATFLGYRVHKTKLSKMKIAYNLKGQLSRRTTNTILEGPVDQIVEELKRRGYAKKDGSPTRNGRFIHHTLHGMIEHYKMVEKGILQYYKLANNYGRVAARVHYILKYSCVLTIASKMKLKTKKRVFNKHGKNLNIKDELGKIIIEYPTVDYRRPKKFSIATHTLDNFSLEAYIDQYDRRVQRGRKDLKGPCILCGSDQEIEVHHVQKLSNTGYKKPKDYLSKMMSRMNRKQVPVCKICHIKIHQGVYDGRRVK
jgi:group II intron reverse transcriptase/maturase